MYSCLRCDVLRGLESLLEANKITLETYRLAQRIINMERIGDVLIGIKALFGLTSPRGTKYRFKTNGSGRRI